MEFDHNGIILTFFLYFNVHIHYMCQFCTFCILKAKSNFTLLLYIPFLGIGEWYFKCV